MDKGNISFKSKVWLGTVRSQKGERVVSISYIEDNGETYHIDINSFRPDPVNKLKHGISYDAIITMEPYRYNNGSIIQLLRSFEISIGKFIRIR